MCVTLFNGIWNYFSECSFTNGRSCRAWSLTFRSWCTSSEIESETEQRADTGNSAHSKPSEKRLHSQFNTSVSKGNLELSNGDFASSNASFFFIKERCCASLKSAKLWSRWSSRTLVLQWDMFPDSTESLSTGCSTESTWTPRFKLNAFSLKTNSQTF